MTNKKLFFAQYQKRKADKKKILESVRVGDIRDELGNFLGEYVLPCPPAKIHELIFDLQENDALQNIDARFFWEADRSEHQATWTPDDFMDKSDYLYHQEVDYQQMRNK